MEELNKKDGLTTNQDRVDKQKIQKFNNDTNSGQRRWDEHTRRDSIHKVSGSDINVILQGKKMLEDYNSRKTGSNSKDQVSRM